MEVKIIAQMDNTIDHTFESANRIYSVYGLAPTIPTCGGGGIQPKVLEIKPKKYEIKCHCVNIPQIVKKRLYKVNIQKLQYVLRKQKKILGLTNRNIATELSIPISQVEHYFRTDSSFAIPEPNIWKPLSKKLDINDPELNKQILSFVEQEGVYEKGERHYLSDGISPTITSADCVRIVESEKKLL